MSMTFLPPNGKDPEEPEDVEGRRLAIQPYPGPMRYAPMAQFLQGFASVFGCAFM